MAAILLTFLLWLFATGKYADWIALLSEPAKKIVASSGAASKATSEQSTQSNDSSINTITDWVNKIYASSSTVDGASDNGDTNFDTSNVMSA